MKIIFAGTPEVAGDILAALLGNGRSPFCVFTQPDRPSGRGQHLAASPVKQLALEHGISVFQPEGLKSSEQTQMLRELAPDLMVVVAYGLILPKEVLAIPRFGCINIHFSLLPRWRGAAPVQQAILAGDQKTGISIIQMDKGLDTGAVLNTVECAILPTDTTEDLFARLIPLAQQLTLQTIEKIEKGEVRAIPQNAAHKTYAHKIEKNEAQINWQNKAIEIDRLIRAFYPWPIAYTSFLGQTLRVFKAHIIDTTAVHQPGLLLGAKREGLEIATGAGILCITEVQLPNKRRMAVQDLLNAFHGKIQPGMVLG